ncbi:MAG TPA: hypothetical protein VMT24_12905 [Aggregatilineaceae bacterium]|nr:hypothetical protein [Aggregatilineaceae bacterium]
MPHELRSESTPPPPAPSPQVVILESAPFVVNPELQIPQLQPRRRRGGCAGCGCFGTLILLIVVLSLLAGGFYLWQPGVMRTWLESLPVTLPVTFPALAPQIIRFTARPLIITEGGSVTFDWQSDGTSARLEAVGQSLSLPTNLPANGTYTLRFDHSGTYAMRLTVSRAGFTATEQTRVVVNPKR